MNKDISIQLHPPTGNSTPAKRKAAKSEPSSPAVKAPPPKKVATCAQRNVALSKFSSSCFSVFIFDSQVRKSAESVQSNGHAGTAKVTATPPPTPRMLESNGDKVRTPKTL